MSKKNNGRNYGRNSKVTNQRVPVAGSWNRTLSPISGGSSNRNFPSAVTENQNINFRTFRKSSADLFCNYDPKKDFKRCLQGHLNAVPSAWTRGQAEQIRITESNTPNVITEPFPRISPDLWVWDMWPLQTKDGSIAVLPGGWRVLFTLSAPRSVLPNNRHDVARIAYFYSRNGEDWIQGGLLFEEGTAFGSRQWAGSAMLDDDGRIYYFYTASGRRGEAQITFEQRIALSSSNFISDLDGVRFVNFAPHQIILEPDGVLYQTLEQSQQSTSTIIYAFRDPWFFKDPATGCEYLLFEGNIAGNNTEINCGPDVPEEARNYTGNIGIALLRNNSFNSWQLLPALLEAGCTNQQTERPHIIVNNGSYYLFTDSHRFTFAPGLTNGPGPDGLYGFVAGSLRGNYQPLNNGGLVIANPPQEPNQAYSWLVLPDFSVLSFIDTFNLQGITTDELSTLPESFQVAHFGGTLAPTIQLRVNGRTTEIVTEYGYGLVMVSETESPKCCRRGAEDWNEGGHGHHSKNRHHRDDDCGCHDNKNDSKKGHHDRKDDCEDDRHYDHHRDNDCGCHDNKNDSKKGHHDRKDDCEDDRHYDHDCDNGQKKERHKHEDDCDDKSNHGHDDGYDCNEDDHYNKPQKRRHDHDCGCNNKDSITFPPLDPNRFQPKDRCSCR